MQANSDNHWTPKTREGRQIVSGQTFWWSDLNGINAPRKVTVSHLDADERLVIVRDSIDTHYMAIPEELQ